MFFMRSFFSACGFSSKINVTMLDSIFEYDREKYPEVKIEITKTIGNNILVTCFCMAIHPSM